MLDLDTGEHIHSYYVSTYYAWPAGTAFDTKRGIGYGNIFGNPFSFRTEDGEVLDENLCGWSGTQGLHYSAAEDRLYVVAAYPFAGGLYYIDLATGDCGPPIGMDCDAENYDCDITGLATSSNGRRLYVSAPSHTQGSADEYGIPGFGIWKTGADVIEKREAQRFYFDRAGPHGFALSPDDSTLYATEIWCNRISVYHARTGEHLYDIPIDGETMGIDLSEDGSQLFVTRVGRGTVLGGGRRYLDNASGSCPPLRRKGAATADAEPR